MKSSYRILSLAIAAAGLLSISGCGGGNSSVLNTGATTPVTVTPSLGKFNVGTVVRLAKSDDTELVRGALGTDGSVTLNVPTSHSGTTIAEVLGDTNTMYYDEGTQSEQSFAKGKKLRAVMAILRATVGVTPLTNAAVTNLEKTKGSIGAAVAADIDDANAKVGKALGLGTASILDAPTLVDATTLTGKTLNVATAADQYALVLAALAKSAATGKTAADAADDLASDLKDNKLDGKDGSSATPTVVLASYTPADIGLHYKTAAAEFADSNSQTIAQEKGLVVVVDVTNFTAAPLSDLALVKAMFTELRTTLNSFSNTSRTGFLDTQAERVNLDLSNNVAPDLNKLNDRVRALSHSIQALEDLRTTGYAGNVYGNLYYYQSTGTNPLTQAAVITLSTGSPMSAWNGWGNYEMCFTDSLVAANVTTITCANANSSSADRANNQLKMMVFEVKTTSTTGNYTYTATRYNQPVYVMQHTFPQQGDQPYEFVELSGDPVLVSKDAANNPMPVGSGTAVKTTTGTGQSALTSNLALNGTFPPSGGASNTGILETTADTVAINVTRGAQTGTIVRYDLTGSVETKKLADQTLSVSLALNAGSYVEEDQANASTTGSVGTAAVLVGSAQTAANKFAGTLSIGSFAVDKNGNNRQPTSVIFDGSVSDTSVDGAGVMLTGKLVASIANYNLYDSFALETDSNYQQNTISFTGTVQAPGRPWLKLVLAGNRTGLTTSAFTVDYSYGIVSLTGSATSNTAPNAPAPVLTLSNQDGIQLSIDTANNTLTGTAAKGGATLANIVNSVINYSDLTSESL